jgi:N-acylneuraminate cytidylyltransferase
VSSTRGTLAVIIGRAGSKGLPGKNWRPLAGRPLVAHTIDDALAAGSVDHVILSTDGDEIAAAGEAMGIDVIRRPAELADDHATVDAAVRHAVTAAGDGHDIIVILYANVPIRPDDLIDRAVRELRSSGADSVQSYSPVGKHHPHWMVRLDADGRVEPFIAGAGAANRRQDLPRLFIPDGGVIAVTRASLFTVIEGRPHAFLGADRRGIELPEGAVVDVDTPVDFALAEAMLGLAAEPARRR